MTRLFQPGTIWLPESTDPLDLEIEVSSAGFWYSINDHVNYRVAADGWGAVDQTYRRKEITSDWYKGSYVITAVPDNTKRTVQVMVKGQTMSELASMRERLIGWFTADDFGLRVRMDDLMETWSCHCADYHVEASQVWIHNRMNRVDFTVSVDPDVSVEMVV